ncbi:MAG: calcium/sodium antiporter, partial [Candidatus Eisenbacteria bacterium]|nr:calcium/sodium antiporter [Candidatus Eisenbacteria bacterium]
MTLGISLGVITLGAEALVRGASSLAMRLGVSPLFVGLTIVGFGTSSPELAASVTATLAGSTDISVGNAIGSNIFNVGIIVGITALIHPIRAQLRAIRRDLMVAILAVATPWLSLAFGGTLPRFAGVLLVSSLITYVFFAYRTSRTADVQDTELAKAELLDTVDIPRFRALDKLWVNVVLIVGGLAMLVLGSKVFVGAALTLARAAGMSELMIGLTIVSAGTSLPELVTSVVAAARRNADIAVGNIIGSNIFNMFGVLGVSAAIRPQTLSTPVV